jgi:hypothetical protein
VLPFNSSTVPKIYSLFLKVFSGEFWLTLEDIKT